MGQRLVITNMIDGERVNNIYYHWSAYTDSTITEIKDLATALSKHFKPSKDPQERKKQFNKACLYAVSGVSSYDKESLDYVHQHLDPDYQNSHPDRNLGLIAFTEDEMNRGDDFAEGPTTIYWTFHEDGSINFDKSTFDLIGLVFKDTPEEYEEYYDTKVEDLPHASIDLDNLPISSCGDLYSDIPSVWYDTGEELVLQKIE